MSYAHDDEDDKRRDAHNREIERALAVIDRELLFIADSPCETPLDVQAVDAALRAVGARVKQACATYDAEKAKKGFRRCANFEW